MPGAALLSGIAALAVIPPDLWARATLVMHTPCHFPNAQARCSAMLEQSLSKFKASSRRQAMPGKGVGFAYEQ